MPTITRDISAYRSLWADRARYGPIGHMQEPFLIPTWDKLIFPKIPRNFRVLGGGLFSSTTFFIHLIRWLGESSQWLTDCYQEN